VNPLLVISDRDNVGTALEPLPRGATLHVRDTIVTLRDEVPLGHKVALTRIETGSAVIKYGSPIGLATRDIPAGAHVHVQNVSSQRGRGDLTQEQTPAGTGPSSTPAGPGSSS
jgi:altronate dehydratase